MKNKLRTIVRCTSGFFMVLSLTCFWLSILAVLRNNAEDITTFFFAACGCAFLIIITVAYVFNNYFRKEEWLNEIKDNRKTIMVLDW